MENNTDHVAHEDLKRLVNEVSLTNPTKEDFHKAVATALVYTRQAGECGMSLTVAVDVGGQPLVMVITNALSDNCLDMFSTVVAKVLTYRHTHGYCDCDEVDGDV